MYQRSKPKVGGATRVAAQPPPARAERASSSRTQRDGSASSKAGADDVLDQAVGLEGVYIISVAARILDMHPQTLRKYERLGLIRPGRTLGMLRLYSSDDIRKVRLIRHLGNMGLNLAGVEFALTAVENLLILKRRLMSLTGESRLRTTIDQEINKVFRSLNLPVENQTPIN